MSVNIVNKTTGDLTRVAGNATDKVGNLNALTTTDKTSIVGGVNELKSTITDLYQFVNYGNLSFNASNMQDYLRQVIDAAETYFPVGITLNMFGAWLGRCTFLIQVSRATSEHTIIYAVPQPNNQTVDKMWIAHKEAGTYVYSTICQDATAYGPYSINATDVKDFIKKVIQQAHSDLATKAHTLYNIIAVYEQYDLFYGTIERQDTAGYAFMLSKATGDYLYQGYCDLSTDYLHVYRFEGSLI